jgi:hypothetical protein
MYWVKLIYNYISKNCGKTWGEKKKKRVGGMASPLHPQLSDFIDEHDDDGVSAYLLTPTAPLHDQSFVRKLINY